MTTATIVKILGQPLHKSHDRHPSSDAEITALEFRDLRVTYMDERHILGIALTGKQWSTARGVSLDDPEEKVMRLYGTPTGVYKSSRDYADPADDSGLHVIRFEIEKGKVTAIFVGHLLD